MAKGLPLPQASHLRSFNRDPATPLAMVGDQSGKVLRFSQRMTSTSGKDLRSSHRMTSTTISISSPRHAAVPTQANTRHAHSVLFNSIVGIGNIATVVASSSTTVMFSALLHQMRSIGDRHPTLFRHPLHHLLVPIRSPLPHRALFHHLIGKQLGSNSPVGHLAVLLIHGKQERVILGLVQALRSSTASTTRNQEWPTQYLRRPGCHRYKCGFPSASFSCQERHSVHRTH